MGLLFFCRLSDMYGLPDDMIYFIRGIYCGDKYLVFSYMCSRNIYNM